MIEVFDVSSKTAIVLGERGLRSLVVALFILGATIPFVYAILRLNQVTKWTALDAVLRFHSVNGATEALQFTLFEALASALLTIVIGLPVAWC